jgi:hypothetical protein
VHGARSQGGGCGGVGEGRGTDSPAGLKGGGGIVDEGRSRNPLGNHTRVRVGVGVGVGGVAGGAEGCRLQ